MTEAELEAMEKACAEATPGPWEWDPGERPDELRAPAADAERLSILNTEGWHKRPELMKRLEEVDVCAIITTDSGNYGPCEADRRFIANARQWVPALVEEVRRLRASLKLAGRLQDYDAMQAAWAREGSFFRPPDPEAGSLDTLAQKFRASIRTATLAEAARAVQALECDTEACGHRACIALEEAGKAIWALKEKP